MMTQRGLTQALTTIAVASLLIPWQAHAGDSSWTITAMSGVVRFQTADERGSQAWRTAAAGQTLPSAFVIETGIDGHAVLGNSDDVINVNENSRVEISDDVAGRLTKAVQSLGNLLYQVLPGKLRRFEVHTPYLVSVVKGTTFTVQVTGEYATVSLLEGLVEVLAKDHMDKRHAEEIHPGEVAIFGRGKTDIQVLEPSSRLLEPSLPLEESLKRLNEALKDLEPVAVEVVKLPANTGTADTGTGQADLNADVTAVEAESAGAAEQRPVMPDDIDRDHRHADDTVVTIEKSDVTPGVDNVSTPPDVKSVRPNVVRDVDSTVDVKPPVIDPPDHDNVSNDGDGQGENVNNQGQDG
jgi:hypothetical protein